MKTCLKCQTPKPFTDFYEHKATKDGYGSYCKVCYSLILKELYISTRTSRIKKAKKRRQQNPKGSSVFYQKNPWCKVKNRIVNRGREVFRKNGISSKEYRQLGCTLKQLKAHFESLFTDGMSWENYGKWEVDHIKPVSKFNLSIPEERAALNHHTNLQPLWKKENTEKGMNHILSFKLDSTPSL